MFRIRRYHTKSRFLRLLDFAAIPGFPAPVNPVVDGDFLLRSRAKLRYGHPGPRLEEATVLAAYFEKPHELKIPDLQSLLEGRLGDADLSGEKVAWQSGKLGPVMNRLVQSTNVSASDLKAYVGCFLAPSFDEAMQIMEGLTWPSFLVLYSLNRKFSSRTEAYHAIKLYLQHIEWAPADYQVEMTSLALRIAQKHIVEMAPPICEIFIAYGAPEAKTGASLNDLLWTLAKFGTTWTKSESLVLVAAQEILVRSIGRAHLDSKGRAGLAYTVLPSSRETALNLVNVPREDINEFAYRAGREMVEILSAQSTEEILGKLNSIEPKYRTPRVWSAALLSLRRNKLLDGRLAERIWRLLGQTDLKFSQQMCELLLAPLQTTREKIGKIRFLQQSGVEISDRILATFFNVSSREELGLASAYVNSFGAPAGTPVVLSAKIAAEAKYHKSTVWSTYCEILAQGAPTVNDLESLCTAAWVPVMWDGLYGVQRVIPEIRSWIRHKAEDVFLLYPTQRLVYAYVFMLGRAQYDDELLDVLPWLEELNFSPEKRVLCALIHYSSHGQALLKLGAKAEGEWPTPGELELYAHGLAKTGPAK